MKMFAWLKASRLASQSYIALPLFLGQLLAWRAHGSWSWEVFALVQAYGLFDQLYIVYANDYADRHDDPLNETATIFSGGSRVLVDEQLTPRHLLVGAWVMAGLVLATGLVIGLVWGRWLVLPLQAVGLGLLWAYSYAPIRMSYRGGGELLQMLGVAGVLPIVGWFAQAGTMTAFPWAILAFLLPMNLATAICTALPDQPSDELVSKRTLPVQIGGAPARLVTIALNVLGLTLYLFVAREALMFADQDFGVATVLFVPVLAIAGQHAAYRVATPGSRGILAFVFFGLLCNLSLVALLCVDAVV